MRPCSNRYAIDADGGTARLTITRIDGSNYSYAIDADDLAAVSRRQWRVEVYRRNLDAAYAISGNGDRRISLAAYLLDVTPSLKLVAGHLDGDPCNARRANLALLTPSARGRASPRESPPATGERCITARDGRYRVAVYEQYRRHYLGTYDALAEAVAARDAWLAAHPAA